MSAASEIRPSWRKRKAFFSPSPSISRAPRKCLTCWKLLAGATGAVRADREDAVLRLHRRRPAKRALLGRLRFARALLAPLDDRRDHLGDHVAGAHHHDLVADPDVLPLQVLLVVQGRRPDRDAADVHRLQHREGEQGPVLPTFQTILLSFVVAVRRRELPGDRPARLAAGDAELALKAPVVHLDHHPVDLEVELVAAVLPPAAPLRHVVDSLVLLDVVVDPEAALAQPLDRLAVAVGLPSPRRAPTP